MAEDGTLLYNSENRQHQLRISIKEFVCSRILQPPEWLDKLDSPFRWGSLIQCTQLVSWEIPDKLSDYSNQGPFYGFEKMAFLLAMLFLKTLSNEEDKMLVKESGSDDSENGDGTKVEEDDDEYEPERAYAKCEEALDEMARNAGDIMYTRIGPALQHVLQATRAHMLFFNGKIAESQELASNILPIEAMSQENKAGLLGLRAKVVMSMVENYQIVLPYLEKAMKLDPDFGYWPYLVGKVLRRARREFDEGAIEIEFGYFEKAVSLERNPKFLVFLAQSYQETAQSMFYSRASPDSANNLLQRAVELYRECWSLKNDSAAISRRVGNGMMKMRGELIDKTVAKEALLKAVELSPKCATHIALGKFYYIHEQNDEMALRHFTKGHPGNFGSSEIIRLNLIKDPSYDPCDILQTWLECEENSVKQYRSYCDAAWYYLMFKKDLETAAKYIWKVLVKDDKSIRAKRALVSLTNELSMNYSLSAAKYIWKVLVKDDKSIRAKRALEFRSCGFCVQEPVNLIEVIVNEILLLKHENDILPLEERKDLKLLENYLDKFLNKYPELHQVNPRPNLANHLKEMVDRDIDAKRIRRYGNNKNRRTGPNRRSEEPGSWRNDCSSDSTQESIRQSVGTRFKESHSLTSRQNDGRSEMRNRLSFSLGDNERRDREYSQDDSRRHSESQSRWSNPRTSVRTLHDYAYPIRYRYNNNRYDVKVTDWRTENRKQSQE